MKFDISKDDRQNKCLNRWKANKGIGGIDAIQRFGKTAIGIKAIVKVKAKHPDGKFLILVPSDIIRQIWVNNSKKLDNVDIYTMYEFHRNIKKYNKEEYILTIIDEIHKFNTNKGLYILRDIPHISRFRLALSGNYPYHVPAITNLYPIVDIVEGDEALEHGWIAPYDEYNLGLSLTQDEQIRYIKYSKYISETLELMKGKLNKFDPKRKYIRDDLDYIFKLRSGLKANGTYIHGQVLRDKLAELMGWSNNIDISTKVGRQINDYWNPNAIYERVKIFKNMISYRNELLDNNLNKLNTIVDIIKFNDVPTIIFTNSTSFVNNIVDKLGSKAVPYHSKIKSRPMLDEDGQFIRYSTGKVKMFGAKRLKDLAMDGIKSGKYKYLVTVKSLDEGLDLPELEQVIVASGSINPIQQEQRTARVKTVDSNNLDKVGKIWNLYIDDFNDSFGISHTSRDKSKLLTRQGNYKHEVLWVESINEVRESQ